MPNPDFIPLGGEPQKSADFIPLEPTGNEKALQNRPDDSGMTGTLKNAGTTVIKGLSHIPGFAGDLRDLTDYLVMRAHSAASGTPMEELQRRRAGAEQAMTDATPSYLRLPKPPSGHDIAAPVLERTGEYEPTTELGRIGAAAGEGGLSMLGPGGVGAGLKAARAGADGLSIAKRILTGGAKAIPGGAASGAVGDVATQLTGDPLAGMVVGSAVPAGAAVAKPALRPVIEPLIPSMRKPAANRMLAGAATDPEAALNTLGSRKAQPGETLGEATLDPGLLQAEKAALNTSDHFRYAMAERDTARHEARTQAINGVAPPADQMAPAKMFRQRLSDIDLATQDAVDRATTQAKAARALHGQALDQIAPDGDPMAPVASARGKVQDVDRATQQTLDRATAQSQAAHGVIPAATPHEVTGEALRSIIDEADKAKGAAVTKLYQAVDPDGTLSLVTSGPRETALEMHKAFDPTVSEPNTATPIIAKMTNLPEVMPFQKLMKLDSTITGKMSEAARNGDRTGHGQLVVLKGSVQNAIDSAIENQHKWEQSAVARGEIEPEGTIGSRLQQDAQQFIVDRKAGRGIVARAANDGPSGSTGVSRPSGGEGQANGRPGVSASPEGVSGDVPNFDAEASERLAAAKDAHKERAQTYRAAPISPALKTTGFAGQYAMPASKVPAVAFPKGETGYHNARAFIRAANESPEAILGLQDIAVSRLREAMSDGELTPKALAKWRQDYAPALRAVDEHVPGFSDRFSNAARATEAVETATTHRKNALALAQTGTAAKFMNLTNPAEVGDTLMGMVKSKTGPTQLADLVGQMDDAGQAGARHALTKSIVRDHTNADGSFASDRFDKFVRDNNEALQPIYGDEGMGRLSKASAISQLSKNIGEAVDTAVSDRKTALSDAQKGTAAKFLGLTRPEEVGDTLMGMVKAKNGPTQLTDLMGQMDPAAQAGAKHALAQTILRDHANADGVLSGAKLRNFLTDNQPALEAVYGKNGSDVLGKLAEDAERYQKASGLQRSKLGSDSFSNFMKWAREKGAGHAADLSIGGVLMLTMGENLMHGDFHALGLPMVAIGARHAYSKLRSNGIHKVNDLVELGMRDPEVGAAMMKSALDNKGQFKTDALEALAKAVARSSAERETLEKHGRLTRASGGKVQKMDHAAMAKKLIDMAEKAKKAHSAQTQGLLKVPDATIASALRLANEAS